MLPVTNTSVRAVGPVQSMREQWIDQQMSTPAIDDNAISDFMLTPNATTKGVDLSFRIANAKGVRSITLLRAVVMDIAQTTVLQTWSVLEAQFTWSDTDKTLQQASIVYYWLQLETLNTNGKMVQVGPQAVLLNPSLLPPVPLDGVNASHAEAVNGAVLVTCNVSSIPSGDSVKILVSGYQGNASYVAITQSASAPVQFTLNATGETITIKAIAVSSGGAMAPSGPTCTLVLNGASTVPAQILNVSVAQIATGNQIMWPASVEKGITNYQIYRGQRGDAFSSASLLATVASTTVGSVIYLDTAGLSGDFQYFIIAVSGSGNSAPSPAANPQVLFSSSQIPGNIPTNTTNNATVDSIDAGSNTTVRIYGPGGVGTGYVRYTGFGTLNRPSGTISGLSYATKYFIMFAAGSYVAVTNYYQALPDGYEWAGSITTVSAGGTGGSSGGGGTGGGGAGCVEVGTEVEVPDGTIEQLESCSEWIVVDLGDGPLKMHPDTLVSVWKRASELISEDRVEVKGALWRKPLSIESEVRRSVKVKRICPGGTYLAGPSRIRLHNMKNQVA